MTRTENLSEAEYVELQDDVDQILQSAKSTARTLGVLSSESKNAALHAIADMLWLHRDEILGANAQDVAAARAAGQTETRVDRLLLTDARIQDMMTGLKQVTSLTDVVGTVLETIERPNGLRIDKIRVPMGVIAMIYESRPNVTVDASALALKTGNAAVLRGGRDALASNKALVSAIQEGLTKVGIAREAVQLIHRVEHESVDILIRAKGKVDLAIPRGGAGLIAHVTERALVPVIETGIGNCHVYVDEAADLEKAEAIIVNAKAQRPSVCNAAETLLVHRAVAETFLPSAVQALLSRGIQLRVCRSTWDVLKKRHPSLGNGEVQMAQEEDWATEFHAPILAVKTVDGVHEAMDHITKYGTKHSEAIVTENVDTANQFLSGIDAAVVYHNASTRFTDGFEFGFGAEIGISTQKLHARGPMGLPELTSYKYVVRGNGQVRG